MITYQQIYNILDTIGYKQSAIAWIDDSKVPDIFIRYYLVDDSPFTEYNDAIELQQARYTFIVYDRSGIQFESIFEELKTTIENQYGFEVFFNVKDSFENGTGHYYKSGDIYFYENKEE